MTGPREWRHAEDCPVECPWIPPECYFHDSHGCTCGLSAARDATAAGHRVVIGPDGVEGRVVDYGVSFVNWPDAYRLVPIEEATE